MHCWRSKRSKMLSRHNTPPVSLTVKLCPSLASHICIKPNLSLSVCVCLCVCVFLLFTHGHIFQRMCIKFGMWHPYALRVVTGGLASAASVHRLALRAPSVCRCRPVANSRPSAVGARIEHRSREK